MNHLFQIRNIVFDQFRRVVAQQNGIGKGVVQFVVDAVYENGQHQPGRPYPAIIPAIQQALQQPVLILGQGGVLRFRGRFRGLRRGE